MHTLGHIVRTSLAVVAWCVGHGAAEAQLAIRAQQAFTMVAKPADVGGGGAQYVVLNDAVILVDEGKIRAIGPAATTDIPSSYRVLTAAVVTPGLIDARCTVGVSGLLNQAQDQDQLERSSPIQPELRAIDAYNPQDPLVEYVRSYGVTTIQTGHAPGEVVSGQLAIFKTAGSTVDEAVVVAESALAVTLSPLAQKAGKSPGTRAKMVAMLREQLIRAQGYQRKRDAARTRSDAERATEPPANASDSKDSTQPDRDLRLEALVRVLEGTTPLVVTANRAQDIASVLRLGEEFKIPLVLDSASESFLLIEQLKAANVSVIVHPTMARAFGELESKSFETAARLADAGIRVAIQGGYESYVPKARVVLFEAGVAAANKLGQERALAAVTIDAAKILKIDARVGSLEVGKDADLALYSGDPFEYTTTCVGVVINGEVVTEQGR